MIVLLDTSTPVCRLFFNEDDWQYANEWEAHRELAKGLLAYLQSQLTAQGKTLKDITGLVAYRGPGSTDRLVGLHVPGTKTMGDNQSCMVDLPCTRKF